MPQLRLPRSLVRSFYHHFYNRFAFTYDTVSGVVSRGEWREWTRSAIPFLRAPRVLEIGFGTGNLLLDLAAAGYQAVGVELSPRMIEIARGKLRTRGLTTPLARARAQALPFPDASFDSAVMTFPPEFAADPRALSEMRRVLAAGGRLVWVDAPWLYPREAWSRFLNFAFRVTGAPPPAESVGALLPHAGWEWRVEKVEHRAGCVHVMIGTKIGAA